MDDCSRARVSDHPSAPLPRFNRILPDSSVKTKSAEARTVTENAQFSPNAMVITGRYKWCLFTYCRDRLQPPWKSDQ